MNAAVILIIGIVILALGYVFYGGWLSKQWGIDPSLSLIHISRLLVNARGAHHVLSAVCHHAGAAEAAADGPRAA